MSNIRNNNDNNNNNSVYIQRMQKQQQHNDKRNPRLDQPFNNTDVRAMQQGGKDDEVLTMVLIEDVMMLLLIMLIKMWMFARGAPAQKTKSQQNQQQGHYSNYNRHANRQL